METFTKVTDSLINQVNSVSSKICYFEDIYKYDAGMITRGVEISTVFEIVNPMDHTALISLGKKSCTCLSH